MQIRKLFTVWNKITTKKNYAKLVRKMLSWSRVSRDCLTFEVA